MSVRRRLNPQVIHHIWDAIKIIGSHHQVVDLPKITKYLQNELGCTIEQAEVHVNNAVLDKLILENKKVVNKTSKSPTLVDGYKIPYEECVKPVDDGKDWYCIECHLAGSVQTCADCHRVFHADCLKTNNSLKNNTLKFLNNKISANNTQQPLQNISVVDPAITFNENENKSDISTELTSSRVENSFNNKNSNLDFTNSPEITVNGSCGDSKLLCSLCRVSKEEGVAPLTREELNYLLGFILERIKSWLPVNLTHKMDPKQQEEQWEDTELEWRANQIWYTHLNMGDIHKKVQCNEYAKLSEFQADVITVRHNVAIFHGFESQEYGAAELMLRDCCHELSELCVCADCYRHSNEKLNNNWFCLPCKNPHRLVWAKQKGYPFWPAKIIREADSVYDVRFFGGKYERSVLPKTSVKPIDTPMDKLQVRHNATFKKALDELHLHQSLLNDSSAVEKLIKEGKLLKEKKKRRSSGLGKSPNKKPLIQIKQDVYEFPDGNEKFLGVTANTKRKSLSPTNKTVKKQKLQQEVTDIVSIVDDDDLSIIKNSHLKSLTDTATDQVTSSTEYIIGSEDSAETQMQELDKPYSDVIEKMRRKLEIATDKNDLIVIAMNSMREEVDRIQAEHAEQLKKLIDEHSVQISETKRKQWCYNCQQDAIYHCCWNTAYCSPTCQQQHWQAEHKKVCRRKR